MDGPWVLDELAHAGPEHLDPGFVAGYDRKQGYPDVTEDLAALDGASTIDGTATIHGAATIVDLGAGTGRFALAAAQRFERVVAVDVSPAMVEVIRSRAAAAELSNLEVVQAGFLGYQHTGQAADAVHTRNALHQLPDFWKSIALQRIAGFLRPGGVLRLRDLVYDFEPAEAAQVFDRWLAGAATDASAGYTSADFAEHIRTEHSTYRWLLEPMLAATGFDIVDASYRGRIYAAYTCRRRP